MTDTVNNQVRKRGRPAKPKLPKSFLADEAEFSVSSTDDVLESVATRATASVDRPPMRPAMREEDPRVLAARRAAEIRGHIGGMDEGTDDFAAPRAPDGWTYEWKRRTVMGQEDPAYQVHLARQGWDPVPTARHPEMMPGHGNYPTIERKGMVLMQRPAVITEEVRDAEYRRAKAQVRVKEQQLNSAPDGQFERNDPRVRAAIKKGFEPMAVPKE